MCHELSNGTNIHLIEYKETSVHEKFPFQSDS